MRAERTGKGRVSWQSRFFAFISVFLLALGVAIALVARRGDVYAKYYMRQGLVLTMAIIALVLVVVVPFGVILTFLGLLLMISLWVIGWLHALSGEEMPIPLIGKLGEKLKL
jgi:uncharacterized membrane protein